MFFFEGIQFHFPKASFDFKIFSVADGESVGEVSSVHPTYVSYTVDGTEQAIYATTTNGQM